MVRANQVVAGGLAGAVGTVGFVAVLLGEGRILGRQGAVDLVRGDMQEAKGRLAGFVQAAPVGAHGFQQAEGADDIGLDEVFRAVNGAIHVAFRSEIDHGARLVLGH